MRASGTSLSAGLLVTGLLVVGLLGSPANADVFNMPSGQTSLQTVTVSNPGNAPDMRYVNVDPVVYGPQNPAGYGSVGYTYQMSKYDVTAGQYCAFLNAVGKTDTYGLYKTSMADPTNSYGCNIQRSGLSGNYSYSVASDWVNRPVNFVSWADAARFANWLSNGQKNGSQDSTTTEDGSYALNGTTSNPVLMSVTRKASATWVIPSEDEWYKAAYYDPNKPGGAGYWDYPTRSNTLPSNALSATGTNNVNYFNINTGYTLGAPYYRTEVGAFAGSPSAYGTYDQGGNVWQWNEATLWGWARGLRGGSFYHPYGNDYGLLASDRYGCDDPWYASALIGFRVAPSGQASLIRSVQFIDAVCSETTRSFAEVVRELAGGRLGV